MTCINRVVIARGPHPIPSRTRSLSLSAPMVLCLKARESRSLPGLLNAFDVYVSTNKQKAAVINFAAAFLRLAVSECMKNYSLSSSVV